MSSQRTFRLRYNPTNTQYDISGTYPNPTGGDNGNIWFNGDGVYGQVEIWVNNMGTWVKIGGDLGERPHTENRISTSQDLPQRVYHFEQGWIRRGGDLNLRPFNKTSQGLPQQSSYFNQGTITYAMH